MNLSKFTEKYVITSTITLNDEGTEFIKFREPNQSELFKFQSVNENDAEASAKALKDLFIACVLDYDLGDVFDGEKVSNKELFEAIQTSGSLYTEIIQGWFATIPFQSRLKSNRK